MAFWKPMVDQWVQASARAFAQTPMTPDALAQWKQFLDQSIDAWSRALGQAMNTEAFAQMLGRYLDQWLVASAPMKKASEQAIDQVLETLNVASRSQLTAVARQIVELEERVERIEEAVNAVLRAVQRERA
jgi:polyhydroxyalkanoic acid synthase PhaR subunit